MKCIKKFLGLIPEEESGWYLDIKDDHVRLRAGNHEIIMSSENYSRKGDVQRSIERISKVTGIPIKN